MIIVDGLEQGSPQWLAARAGRVSASCFDKVLTPTGSKTSGQTRKNYLYQLAGERISGEPEEGFKSEWMQRGNELEADARLLFEERQAVLVAQVGLVYMDDRKTISCSPDGIIAGQKKGFECKCPKLSTHVGYLDNNRMVMGYVPQVQGSMMVTGYESWWFMSYHPVVRPLILQVERDEKYIALLKEAVEEFNAEVSALVGRLK